MSFIELLLIAIGLSMDAFAVAVCKGLNMKKINYKHTVIIAIFFGGFQAIMPLIGWSLGIQFEKYINGFDHWLTFTLLSVVGGKMIYEALKNDGENNCKDVDKLNIKELFVLSIATSIDALAVGITFALIPDTNIISSIVLIGIITFILSAAGVLIGNKFGSHYKTKAEIAGGIIIILIGIKILTQHLGIISF
jgi:manganese efflux pump family protein